MLIFFVLSLSLWGIAIFHPELEKVVPKMSAQLALVVFGAIFISLSLWYIVEWLIRGKPKIFDVNERSFEELGDAIKDTQKEVRSIKRRLTKLEGLGKRTKAKG